MYHIAIFYKLRGCHMALKLAYQADNLLPQFPFTTIFESRPQFKQQAHIFFIMFPTKPPNYIGVITISYLKKINKFFSWSPHHKSFLGSVIIFLAITFGNLCMLKNVAKRKLLNANLIKVNLLGLERSFGFQRLKWILHKDWVLPN